MYELDNVIILPQYRSESLPGVIIKFSDNLMVVKCHTKMYFPISQKVCIIIYNSAKGEIHYEGALKNVSREFMVLENLKYVMTKQRRKDARVEVNFILPVKKIFVSDDQPISLNKNLLMRAMDISSSGILLHSEIDIPAYVRFNLEIPLLEATISCVSEIARKDKGTSGFQYGCKFSLLTEKEKDVIRKFVFKKQIDEHRKKNQSQEL